MKFSFIGAAAALAAVAVLAGCGGKQQFVVQGAVSNLNNNGLVLLNAGEQLTVRRAPPASPSASRSAMAATTTSPSRSSLTT